MRRVVHFKALFYQKFFSWFPMKNHWKTSETDKKVWKQQKSIVLGQNTQHKSIVPTKRSVNSDEMVEQAQTFIAFESLNLALDPLSVDFKYSKFNNNLLNNELADLIAKKVYCNFHQHKCTIKEKTHGIRSCLWDRYKK